MTFYSFIGIAVTSATVVRVWAGDLGSGGSAGAAWESGRGGDRDGGAADGDAQRERGRQRGFARERLFESLAAADQLPHGRADHLCDRRRDAAVEAAGELWQLRFRMAGRLFGLSRSGRRHLDLRLFRPAKKDSDDRGSIPARRHCTNFRAA